MELSLPDMPFGMGGRRARAAAHPGESCRQRRQRKLVRIWRPPARQRQITGHSRGGQGSPWFSTVSQDGSANTRVEVRDNQKSRPR